MNFTPVAPLGACAYVSSCLSLFNSSFIPFYPEIVHWSWNGIPHPPSLAHWLLGVLDKQVHVCYTHASSLMMHPLRPAPKPVILKTDVMSFCSLLLKLNDTQRKLFSYFSSWVLPKFLPKISKLDFSFKSNRQMNSKSVKQVNPGHVFCSALVKTHSYNFRMGVVRDEWTLNHDKCGVGDHERDKGRVESRSQRLLNVRTQCYWRHNLGHFLGH